MKFNVEGLSMVTWPTKCWNWGLLGSIRSRSWRAKSVRDFQGGWKPWMSTGLTPMGGSCRTEISKWWLVTCYHGSYLVKWQSWGFLAFLHKLFSGRPEGGKWVRAVQYKCQTKSARVGLHIKEIYEWLCHGGEWGRPPLLLGEIITTLARLKFEETFCNTLQCFVALLLGWFDVVMSTVRRCYVFIKLNERSEQQWPVVYE